MVELVYYWAEWCGPCKMMSPILSQIEQELQGKITITKINVDSNKAEAQSKGIRSVPTIFIYKNGIKIDQQIGAAPKSVIISKLRM